MYSLYSFFNSGLPIFHYGIPALDMLPDTAVQIYRQTGLQGGPVIGSCDIVSRFFG